MTVNNNYLVSIIVPCFNCGHLISQTLDSLSHQTHTQNEYIIIDDGSTDNTKEVVEAYIIKDIRFKYINIANSGVSFARNIGIKASKGEFIQFLDGDDLIESHKLELQVQFLSEHPDVDIVYGDAFYFKSDQPSLRLNSRQDGNQPWMPKVSGKDETLINQLILNNIMVISSPLIRKSVIDRCGYFADSMKYCEDYEYWLRCALLGLSFYFLDLPQTATMIRIHPQSASYNNTIELLKGQLKALEASTLSKKYNNCQQILEKKISDLKIEVFNECIESSLKKMLNGKKLSGYIEIFIESVRKKNVRTFILGFIAMFFGVQRAYTVRSYIKKKTAI